MCNQQTLFYDPAIGYVVHCAVCRHVQLAFGNLAITLDTDEFQEFKERIQEIGEQEMLQCTGPSLRTICVSTPCRGMNIILNPFELGRLCNMLDQADTELKSLQLMGLFAPAPED